MTDKNLFMYDLAVVAIIKNEGLYIKEWLDYHLLAGVNHFYLYDNNSTDNIKEILQPYIDKDIVTYTFYPGKARQYEAYNDAVLNYRFFCRYMAFIDADEFIFPQDNKSIVEVLDEILSDNKNAAGLAVNIHQFGSNFQETADYNRGILDRFTMCKAGCDNNVSTIANPRKVDYFWSPHFAEYFFGTNAINEIGEIVEGAINNPPTADRMVMNHYSIKSREEYQKKVARGAADFVYNIYEKHPFAHIYNDMIDDGILKYRDGRKSFSVETSDDMQAKIFHALEKNLLSANPQDLPKEFFKDKLENFLVCLAVSEKFKFKYSGRFLSEYALFWIYQTLHKNFSIADLLLFFSELPKILNLPYPIVKEIHATCIKIIPMTTEFLRSYMKQRNIKNNWKKIMELKYLLEMLKIM